MTIALLILCVLLAIFCLTQDAPLRRRREGYRPTNPRKLTTPPPRPTDPPIPPPLAKKHCRCCRCKGLRR